MKAQLPIIHECHPEFSSRFTNYNSRIEAYVAYGQNSCELRYYTESKSMQFLDKKKHVTCEFDGIISENAENLLLEVKYRKSKQSLDDDIFSHVQRKINTLSLFYPTPIFVGIVNADYYDLLHERAYTNFSTYHRLRLGDSLCKMRVNENTIFSIQEYLRKNYSRLQIDFLSQI